MKPAEVGVAVLVMLLWALCYPAIAAGLGYAPPLRFAAWRAILGGGALIGAGMLLGRTFPRGGKRWLALWAVGMTTTTLGFGAMFLAGGIVPPGIATVISNAQPLIAAPIASAMLGERVKGAGVALLTGFTGIVLISVPSMTASGSRINLYGTGLVLLAALGAAIGNVGMKALAGKVDPVMATGAQLLIGAAPLQALSLVLERDVRTAWSGTFLVSMASLALLGTGLAFLLWFKLLERVELNKLNTFTFLAPVAALALSAWMYGERLGLMESAGVALVLVAVAISTGTFRLWIAGRSSQERAR